MWRYSGAYDPCDRGGAVRQRRDAIRDLRHRDIHHRDGISIEPEIVNVANHADDLAGRFFEFWAVSLPEDDAFSNGVAIGPESPGQGVVDYGYACGSCFV